MLRHHRTTGRPALVILSCLATLLAVLAGPAPAQAGEKSAKDPADTRPSVDIRKVRFVNTATSYKAVVHIPHLRRRAKLGVELVVVRCPHLDTVCPREWTASAEFDAQGQLVTGLYVWDLGYSNRVECPGLSASVHRKRVTIEVPNGCAGAGEPGGEVLWMQILTYIRKYDVHPDSAPSSMTWRGDRSPQRAVRR
ncbi:hypothetical protein ACJ5H2_02030 [Nocardioides sp. R1-1]|uniref:hypothetical protein n=1 Tax=Nocardioides sp. R1-1 TaxID=3383502 RepID=UPI0038D0E054